MPDWAGRRRWWPLGFTLRRLVHPWLLRRRRRTISAAAALATVGPWVRPNDRGFERKRVDVPFGVRTSDFPFSPLPDSGFTAMYVGRYDEARGVLDLARAASAVVAEIPGFKMIFVGDGPMRSQLDAIAHETMPEAIEVRGRVPHEEVGRLISESSVFCMPSWGEPFGMAVIEAMSAGRPIIAAEAGALAWLVTDESGGRLVPPRDVGALAHALRELASDRVALARMGAFNRRQVEEHFDLDVVVRRWEAVYCDAISAAQPVPAR
jgi:glycosyltransferase involved in cell wall biosynthesis